MADGIIVQLSLTRDENERLKKISDLKIKANGGALRLGEDESGGSSSL